jgi:hypothetical protein
MSRMRLRIPAREHCARRKRLAEVAANKGPFDEPSGVVLGGSDDPRPSDYDGD